MHLLPPPPKAPFLPPPLSSPLLFFPELNFPPACISLIGFGETREGEERGGGKNSRLFLRIVSQGQKKKGPDISKEAGSNFCAVRECPSHSPSPSRALLPACQGGALEKIAYLLLASPLPRINEASVRSIGTPRVRKYSFLPIGRRYDHYILARGCPRGMPLSEEEKPGEEEEKIPYGAGNVSRFIYPTSPRSPELSPIPRYMFRTCAAQCTSLPFSLWRDARHE